MKTLAMKRLIPFFSIVLSIGICSAVASNHGSPDSVAGAPASWQTVSPRDELRPAFAFDPHGGVDGNDCFIIRADARDGLDGSWTRIFRVAGGKHYRFSASYKATAVAVPRRSIVAKLDWQDARGNSVPLDEPAVTNYLRGAMAMAETEFPATHEAGPAGWTEMSDTYRAPGRAVRAVVSLHLQWAPDSEVRWSNVSLTQVAAPPPRTVRLATVHYRPSGGKTPMDNCRQFEPLITEAARQKADLVVLGETLDMVNLGRKPADIAEPFPGPATTYFGELARKYGIYIVAGLLERDGRLVYNSAVLLGPDGRIVGKYRKTCLPRSEVESGICPGLEYPVLKPVLESSA